VRKPGRQTDNTVEVQPKVVRFISTMQDGEVKPYQYDRIISVNPKIPFLIPPVKHFFLKLDYFSNIFAVQPLRLTTGADFPATPGENRNCSPFARFFWRDKAKYCLPLRFALECFIIVSIILSKDSLRRSPTAGNSLDHKAIVFTPYFLYTNWFTRNFLSHSPRNYAPAIPQALRICPNRKSFLFIPFEIRSFP
jgi:hypothetical protein